MSLFEALKKAEPQLNHNLQSSQLEGAVLLETAGITKDAADSLIISLDKVMSNIRPHWAEHRYYQKLKKALLVATDILY